jgi:hypothetical protein
MPYFQARALIAKAGFKLDADDQTHGEVEQACLKIGQSWPDGGERLEMGKTVRVVLIPLVPCSTPTPSVTVTTTVKP